MKNKEQIFPFLWPWRKANKESLPLIGVLKSRAFSIIYLVVIWAIVGLLGFASTRANDCGTSWQLSFYCEYAFWAKNLTEAPWIFFRNLFSTLFFHNGLDHILFVSVLGILLIVQSHEARFSSRETFLIFLSAYVTVAPFFAVFYNIGLHLFPDSEFIQFAFARNWMGGSLGMFQVYGSLATNSRKPWVMLMVPVVFEIINLTVLGIDLHISLMHLMGTFLGYWLSVWFIKKTN